MRHRRVDGVEVQLTPTEEVEADAREAQHLADKPMNDWLRAMAVTDDIPRALEDIYDAMPATQQGNVDTYTRDKIIAKKELRATKP